MKKSIINKSEAKVIFYCSGIIIIMSLWLILRTGNLSDYAVLMSGLLILFGYVAMVFDINTKKIPNILVLSMLAAWLLLIAPLMFVEPEIGVRILLESVYGFAIGGGLFLFVYFISSKGLGGGDVKFMAVSGLYLGLSGTISSILYGTVLAAVTGLLLILIKKIGRKDAIPLAPFLFAGMMITLFVN